MEQFMDSYQGAMTQISSLESECKQLKLENKNLFNEMEKHKNRRQELLNEVS